MVLSFRDVSKFPSVNMSDVSLINSESSFNFCDCFSKVS